MTPLRGTASRLTFVDEDDSVVIPLPPRAERSASEEYIIPIERFHFIQYYFTFVASKPTESIEMTLDGRSIKLIGISEEESLDEFKKAFGDFIHPVVRNTELFAVIDRFLEEELARQFGALMPQIAARGMGLNPPSIKLNEDETSQVYRELDQCSAIIPRPGDLRSALERISDVRTKRGLLSCAEPIITPVEIGQAQEAMKIRKLQRSFMALIRPVVRPEALREALNDLPEEYKEHFRGLVHLVQKRIDAFKTLIGEYTAIYTMEFVLGEELNKRILKNLPIQWRLPKENVPRFQALLEYQQMGMKARESAATAGPAGDIVFLGCDEAAYAETLLKEFREVKDYYLDERIFPTILPFTNMSLHPFPRVERIKQALRAYFPIENLRKCVTGDMVAYCEQIRRGLSHERRDELGDALENVKSTEEKLIILQRYNLPPFECEPGEMAVFVHFLTLFVPKINELLMSAVDPDDDPYGLEEVTEEMHEYYARIKAVLSSARLHELIERIEEARSMSDKVDVLGEFPLPEHDFSPKDLKKLAAFLPLVLGALPEDLAQEPLHLETSVHDELIMLERNALKGLDTSCADAQVLVTFRQEGREIFLGTRNPDSSEVVNFMHQLELDDWDDNVPDSYPSKAVLVNSDDEWDNDL